jgi:predicted DNA-binding antitoxin AbrB/MazE fold protein
MDFGRDIPVIFEGGVFKPQGPVDIPEHSRLSIRIHETEGAPQRNGHTLKETLEALRDRNLLRTGGWRPRRDELHERG